MFRRRVKSEERSTPEKKPEFRKTCKVRNRCKSWAWSVSPKKRKKYRIPGRPLHIPEIEKLVPGFNLLIVTDNRVICKIYFLIFIFKKEESSRTYCIGKLYRNVLC